MTRVYVDEYDKVASIVRGDGPDDYNLWKCQQRLFGWCSATYVLKRQLNEAQAQCKELLGAISSYQLHTHCVPETVARNLAKAKLKATEHLLLFITEAG